jgi:hypothetical protein
VVGGSQYDNTVNYLTDVGAYASSPSYYGTFDQGGNVVEWNEKQEGGTFARRGTLGGAWFYGYSEIRSVPSYYEFVGFQSRAYGFRVASIPEPAGVFLSLCGAAVLILSGRKRDRPTAAHKKQSKTRNPGTF